MSNLQQINLLLPEFQKEKHPLRFVTILSGWGLIFFFLGSLQMWGFYQTEDSRERLANLQSQEVKVLQQLQNLQNSTSRNNGAQLDNNIGAAQAEVKQRRQLLRILKGQDVGNISGFSDYLISLSRQHTDGISLEYIDLIDGGAYVELSGWTYRPELIPEFIQRLRSEDSFEDTLFGNLAIERIAGQSTDALRFELGESGRDGS